MVSRFLLLGFDCKIPDPIRDPSIGHSHSDPGVRVEGKLIAHEMRSRGHQSIMDGLFRGLTLRRYHPGYIKVGDGGVEMLTREAGGGNSLHFSAERMEWVWGVNLEKAIV